MLKRRTYIGVAYGEFDPSAPGFSLLLPVSVSVSLLSAGSTSFGLEFEGRKETGVSLVSCYGVVAVLLHTAQVAALIFWVALLGCALKGQAWWAMVLAVVVFAAQPVVMVVKAMENPEENPSHTISPPHPWTALGVSVVHLSLIGVMAAVFFVTAEHVDNNYANKTLPIGGPGSGSGPDDPQYFDCHERTSGLYPAYLATGLCVVLTPLHAALDPLLGCCGGTRVRAFV
eukprot:COSAG04_NODE_1515_length_6480_cov_5.513086_2_plen_229_part_00